MSWTWDPDKDRINQDKHKVGFEIAQRVFYDHFAVTQPDPYLYESRWRTTGCVQSVTLLVVHTWPETHPIIGELPGRIISARKATRLERLDYEEGYL